MIETEAKVKYKDKGKYSFTLSEEVYNDFRIACKALGMKMSPRMEVLLKKDTENLTKMKLEDETNEN